MFIRRCDIRMLITLILANILQMQNPTATEKKYNSNPIPDRESCPIFSSVITKIVSMRIAVNITTRLFEKKLWLRWVKKGLLYKLEILDSKMCWLPALI